MHAGVRMRPGGAYGGYGGGSRMYTTRPAFAGPGGGAPRPASWVQRMSASLAGSLVGVSLFFLTLWALCVSGCAVPSCCG